MGSQPHPRRLVRRLIRRGRRLRGAARDRHRHRRIHPAARGGLRHRRHEAHLRWLVPVRTGGVRLVARHTGSAGAHGAGRGAAARGDIRSRPVRLDLGRRAGAARRGCRQAGRRRRAARRRGRRVQRRRLPGRGAGPLQRGRRAARVTRRQGRRGVLPALHLRPAGLLPDRAERGSSNLARFDGDAVRTASGRRRHWRAPTR